VTRQLRAWTQVPIIVLSARGMEVDKVAASTPARTTI
jgi:DNA-binding response OmpR family regulator